MILKHTLITKEQLLRRIVAAFVCTAVVALLSHVAAADIPLDDEGLMLRVMTGHAVLTPMLMVIVMITGDFLAMSLTTDRVRPSETPNTWQIARITSAGVILGTCFLAFCTAVLAVGKFEMGLGVEALQTLSVVAIVFGSQATIYAIRSRRHLWGLRPTIWLVLSSVADLLIISTLATCGIAMASIPVSVVAGEFAAAVAFGLILDGVKIPVFAYLRIS